MTPRVVIDTNVLVSGVLNPHGAPGRIVDAILAGAVTVLHDDRILHEYRAVLSRPAFGFRPSDVEAFVAWIEQEGEPVLAPLLKVTLPHPTDLPFLEVAAAGRAEALIAGNVRHYGPRRGQHGVAVTTPAAFMG